jgi:hypothetical protein
MKFKSGRGGIREGAGRKKGSTGPYLADLVRRKRFQVRLPGYLVEWLRSEDRAAGRIVEDALMLAHGKDIEKFRKGLNNANDEND